MRLPPQLAAGALALATLAMGAGAGAQTLYPMAGSWAQNRSRLLDLPLTGDKRCPINLATNPPAPFVMGDLGQPQRAGGAGCIPGSGTVRATGPAVAPRAFTLMGVSAGGAGSFPFRQTGAVPRSAAFTQVGYLVQLATSFTFQGPGSVTVPTYPAGTATGSFMADAWLAQSGRAGPSFAWCPGGATQNPVCTSPNPSQNGAGASYNGLVRYAAGTNAFGGTMTMLVEGTGTRTIPFYDGPLGTARVLHLPAAGRGVQQPGGRYWNLGYDRLGSGTVKQSPVYSAGGLITGSVTPSPTIMTGYSTDLRYGFPWTTGQVYVRNTAPGPFSVGTTLTATGSDLREADGRGVITLVAGGTTHRLSTRILNFASIDIVRMSIGLPDEMPASSPAGLAAGAALMLLAVGYALRRRP